MNPSLVRYNLALLSVSALVLFSLAFLPVSFNKAAPNQPASPQRAGRVEAGPASLLGTLVATVSANPLTVTVVPPKNAFAGKTFTIKAEVENSGEVAVKDARAEILLPVGLILPRGDTQKTIGKIPARRTKSVSWRVEATEAGEYVVVAQVEGEVNAQVITEQDSAVITVQEPRQKGKNAVLSFLDRILDVLTGRLR